MFEDLQSNPTVKKTNSLALIASSSKIISLCWQVTSEARLKGTAETDECICGLVLRAVMFRLHTADMEAGKSQIHPNT